MRNTIKSTGPMTNKLKKIMIAIIKPIICIKQNIIVKTNKSPNSLKKKFES